MCQRLRLHFKYTFERPLFGAVNGPAALFYRNFRITQHYSQQSEVRYSSAISHIQYDI